ncbi:MAG: hypothetical protein OXH57_11710, partial [Ekhidna sp.]|nr:hypothetical protein [Ekhidna sp.]
AVACEYVEILRMGGTGERASLGTNIFLNKGDIVRCVTATGGGYGNPSDRPASQVKLDIKNGYITQEEAEKYYPQTLASADCLDISKKHRKN